MVWDLEGPAAARRGHGPEAVLHILDQSELAPTPARAPARQRTLANATTGARAADLTTLGYTSPGSPG